MSDDFDPDDFLNATLADEDEGSSDKKSGKDRDPFAAARKVTAAKNALADSTTATALVAAARKRSPEARGLLVQGLNELCLKSGMQLSDGEKQMVFEIFDRLLQTVQSDVRGTLSEHLADRDDAPKDLITRLARDAIEVAAPILSRSILLGDEDLVSIVQDEAEGHQLAVTRRETLSGVLTEALAQDGSDIVLIAMLENEGAVLHEEVMLRITESAIDRPALHGPLVRRPDLPMRAARRLYSVVDPALKETIEQHMKALEDRPADGSRGDGDSLSAAMADAGKRFDARERGDADAGPAGKSGGGVAAPSDPGTDPDDLMDMSRLPSDLGANRPHPRLLVKALMDGDYEEFERLFGEFAELNSGGVDRILNRAGPEALAIACKAGGMDKQAFGEVLARVMDQDKPGEAARTPAYRKTITYFDRIDSSGAARVLQAWR